MAWTDLTNVTTGQLIDATLFNNILDNQRYLLERAAASQIYVAGSNYTTTSTSFVDVDATNLKITIAPASDRLLVLATARFYVKGNLTCLDLAANSVRAGDTNWGLAATSSTEAQTITVAGYWSGLTPGNNYDVTLQWKTSSGTAMIFNNTVNMWGIDI